jgi:hypothetical protein
MNPISVFFPSAYFWRIAEILIMPASFGALPGATL